MDLNKKITGGGLDHISTIGVWIVVEHPIFKNYGMFKTLLIAIPTNYVEGIFKIILKSRFPIVIRSVINKEIKPRL